MPRLRRDSRPDGHEVCESETTGTNGSLPTDSTQFGTSRRLQGISVNDRCLILNVRDNFERKLAFSDLD